MNAVNAYPELVTIARQIRLSADDDDPTQSAQFVAAHREQLAAARRALSQPCRVEMRMAKSYYDEHWPDVVKLRHLIRLFTNEARKAVRQANWPQVIRSSLDLLQLGNGVRRGGMIIDMLVASVGSGVGIEFLRKHRTQFTYEQQALIARELVRLEEDSEPIEAIIARDRAWEIAADYQYDPEFKSLPEESNVPLDFQQALHDLAVQVSQLPPEQQHHMERAHDKLQHALLRLLIIDLALQRYHHAHGTYPNQLHWLAPKYLAAVPLDPFTAANFIYRRHADVFELYSPGPKLTDTGGVFGHKSQVLFHRADLCLDVGDYELPDVCEI